jgi:hypothetical protein
MQTRRDLFKRWERFRLRPARYAVYEIQGGPSKER